LQTTDRPLGTGGRKKKIDEKALRTEDSAPRTGGDKQIHEGRVMIDARAKLRM
jgi:hypothetical protein